VLSGQPLTISYEVTNVGTVDTLPGQTNWSDMVYLSADPILSPQTDPFLGSSTHPGPLAAGAKYTGTFTTPHALPRDLSGTYYVIVVTDAITDTRFPRGVVFEADETNNTTASKQPIIIDQPPPADLEVTSIDVPKTGQVGQTVHFDYTVVNEADNAASGVWTDSVYLSADDVWDASDLLLGRVKETHTSLAK